MTNLLNLRHTTGGSAPPKRTSAPRPSDAAVWAETERRLQAAPELEAKVLFEHLQMLCPEQVREGQVRTFQRRVRQWRLTHGPAPEVIFPQTHQPGEVLQLDWTHPKELGVTIAGQPLDHLLCQAVLP